MPESNLSKLLTHFFVYYSTVNENSTNNVPVVFFTPFYLDAEGKMSPLFQTRLSSTNE